MLQTLVAPLTPVQRNCGCSLHFAPSCKPDRTAKPQSSGVHGFPMELSCLAGPASLLRPEASQAEAPWDGPMMVTFSAMLPGDSPCCRPFGSQTSTRRSSSGSTTVKRASSKASSMLLHRPSSCMLTGPCRHCGINFSPQWRKGTHDKPVLCNACGIRLRRHKCLDESTAYKGPPLPPVVYVSPSEELAKGDASASQDDEPASTQQDAPSTSRPALVLMLPAKPGKYTLLPATAVSKAGAAAAAANAPALRAGPTGKRGRATVQLRVPSSHNAVSEGEGSAGSEPEGVATPAAEAAGTAGGAMSAEAAAAGGAAASSCHVTADAMDIDASHGSGANGSAGSGSTGMAATDALSHMMALPVQCSQSLLLLHNGWPLVDGVAMEPEAVAAAINAALAAASADAAQAAAAAAAAEAAAAAVDMGVGKEGVSMAAADAEVCKVLGTAAAAAAAAAEEAAALGASTPVAVEADVGARSASPDDMEEEATAAADADEHPAKRRRIEQQEEQQRHAEEERAAQHSPSSDSGSSEDGSSGGGSSEDERAAVAGAAAAKAAANALLLRSMEATTCMTDGAARLVLPQSVMA